MESYAYLIINLASISLPLAFSFGPRIRFVSKWKGLIAGLMVMMAVFISWDIAFTDMGVWGFNPRYLTGLDIVNLPVEEWLFFICIPYACLFTYEALKHFVRRDVLGRAAPYISGAFVLATFYRGIVQS